MEFRIADTFTSSLAKLAGDEQKAVKTTAFDLQMNPAAPGLQFHKLDKARDKNFWSVRVNSDIRLIVHRTQNSLLLCYVAHHDDAYAWGERRKLETHPTTGAAQLVEIRETVIEIPIERYIEVTLEAKPVEPKPKLFAAIPEEDLLGYGVPPEWITDVLLANEDTLFELAEHLPAEASEALLELAVGGKPVSSRLAPPDLTTVEEPEPDPFKHPDAQRRFRTIHDVEELSKALDYPWDRWTIFLHPAQRQTVERSYSGPARVSGSAGTGKTVVALHRAVFLARQNPDARILLTTFSDALANALRNKLFLLIRHEPKLAEQIDVESIHKVGQRLYRTRIGDPRPVFLSEIRRLLVAVLSVRRDIQFSHGFVFAEWRDVVDSWQLRTWEEYRDVRRLGRKTRLREEQRKQLWEVFEQVQKSMLEYEWISHAGMFQALADQISSGGKSPFEFAVVDEAQDISITQLRFLAAMGGGRPNALFFAGDLGQRIFQQPFSWLAQGVDIRGRARNLHINYRTSHQIRSQSDRLLGKEVSDVDGIVEDRSGTVSVFNGPPPIIRQLSSPEEEIATVGDWLRERLAEGVKPHEIGIFVRSEAEIARAESAANAASLPFTLLKDTDEHAHTNAYAEVGTMHNAKGLEYKAVAVMACDDEVIPLQERIETVTDPSELEEVYNTERHLLYVACTRARDHLLVTSGGPRSEFLDDLQV